MTRRPPSPLVRLAWRLFWTQIVAPLRKHPLLLLLLLIVAAGGWYSLERTAREEEIAAGIPQEDQLPWYRPLRIFRNAGYMVGYSEWHAAPLWVSYRLFPKEEQPTGRRPSHFETDSRSLARIDHEDYTRSGYDRGHMAPNHAIALLYGREAQLDTFLMTNIVPQKPNLNQKLWQRLEAVEISHFAQQFGTVWVITGPLFSPEPQQMNHRWLSIDVDIPTSFYKIYLKGRLDQPESLSLLAFEMPQEVGGKEPLDQFITSVDLIEQKSGLNFFWQINDEVENRLEARTDTAAEWRLNEVARQPSRY